MSRSVAHLSDMACRLLLHYLQMDGETESSADAMAGAGIKHTSFYSARSELKRFGILLDNGDIDFPVGQSEQDSESGFDFSAVIEKSQVDTPASRLTSQLPPWLPQLWEAQLRERLNAPRTVVNTDLPEQLDDKMYSELQPTTMEADEWDLEESWIAKASVADRMDPSGDERDVKSPFQARRRAQIEVVQGAYRELLNAMLVGANAKELLRLAGNYAEPVVEAIEQTAGQPKKIDYPLGYIKTILKRQAVEALERTNKPLVNRTAIGPTNNDNYYLDKPTERTRKVVERLKQLQAEGKLVLHDDDIPEE